MTRINLATGLKTSLDTTRTASSTPRHVARQLLRDPMQWFSNYAMTMGTALTWWGFYLDHLNKQSPNPDLLWSDPWAIAWIPAGFALAGLAYTIGNVRHCAARRSGNYFELLWNQEVKRETWNMLREYNHK